MEELIHSMCVCGARLVVVHTRPLVVWAHVRAHDIRTLAHVTRVIRYLIHSRGKRGEDLAMERNCHQLARRWVQSTISHIARQINKSVKSKCALNHVLHYGTIHVIIYRLTKSGTECKNLLMIVTNDLFILLLLYLYLYIWGQYDWCKLCLFHTYPYEYSNDIEILSDGLKYSIMEVVFKPASSSLFGSASLCSI